MLAAAFFPGGDFPHPCIPPGNAARQALKLRHATPPPGAQVDGFMADTGLPGQVARALLL